MGHSARFELKYLIQEARAVAVADFISSYLNPSEHNGSGHKNRMKLRIRFYDDEWTRPAFLEVKRRVSDVICKDRAMISREGARQILSAGWPNQPYFPDTSQLVHGKRRQDVNADFWHFASTVRARGAIYVSYFREIWESPVDEDLHVTLDREIRGSRYDGSGTLRVPQRGWRPYLLPYLAPLPKDGVILELKFDERPPRWMLDLVKIFNLHQIPVCKYTACVYAQQLQHGRQPLPEQEEALKL